VKPTRAGWRKVAGAELQIECSDRVRLLRQGMNTILTPGDRDGADSTKR
jgi:hypothetical protein